MTALVVRERARIPARRAEEHLTEAEARFARRLAATPWRRTEWLHGRVVAKEAVLEALGWQGEELGRVAVLPGASGRPAVAGAGLPADLRVSISHTDAYAAGAAAWQPVGVDVERVDAALLDLLPRYCSPADTPAADAFQAAALWALKEAAVKCDTSASASRRHHRAEVDWVTGAAAVEFRREGAPPRQYTGTVQALGGSHVLAVAWLGHAGAQTTEGRGPRKGIR